MHRLQDLLPGRGETGWQPRGLVQELLNSLQGGPHQVEHHQVHNLLPQRQGRHPLPRHRPRLLLRPGPLPRAEGQGQLQTHPQAAHRKDLPQGRPQQPPVGTSPQTQVEVHYIPVFRVNSFEGKYIVKIIVQQGDPAQVYLIT